MDWQPIDTMPRDLVAEIIVTDGCRVDLVHCVSRFESVGSLVSNAHTFDLLTELDLTGPYGYRELPYYPTNWMPLPEPPEEQGKDKPATNSPDEDKMRRQRADESGNRRNTSSAITGDTQ